MKAWLLLFCDGKLHWHVLSSATCRKGKIVFLYNVYFQVNPETNPLIYAISIRFKSFQSIFTVHIPGLASWVRNLELRTCEQTQKAAAHYDKWFWHTLEILTIDCSAHDTVCHRPALITGHTSGDFTGTRRGMSCYHIQSVMSCYICHGLSQQWRCSACDGVYKGISLQTSTCQKTSTSRMAYMQRIARYREDVQVWEMALKVKRLHWHQFYTFQSFQRTNYFSTTFILILADV